MTYEENYLFQTSGSQLTPSFQNGVAGFSFWYNVPGAEGKGTTLTEVRWDRGFVANNSSVGGMTGLDYYSNFTGAASAIPTISSTWLTGVPIGMAPVDEQTGVWQQQH